MRCPKCGTLDDKVIDSRLAKEGTAIRRRRACLGCENRYTTYESVEREDLRVIKRDGRSEPFDREKILKGITKACEKRAISFESQQNVVDEIINEFEPGELREVPSKLVGAKVMQKLRELDAVAYVRYASVYRSFEDVGEFIEEIQTLEKQPRVGPLQAELFNEQPNPAEPK